MASPDGKQFWMEMLQSQLKLQRITLNDVFFMGTDTCLNIAKRLTNPFWKEVFFSFSETLKAAEFQYPQDFFSFNLWGNFSFLRANRPLTISEFSSLRGKKVAQVGNFFDQNGSFLSCTDFNNKYGTLLNFLKFESLKSF